MSHSANRVSIFYEFTLAQIADEGFKESRERQIGFEIRSQVREGQTDLLRVRTMACINYVCRTPTQLQPPDAVDSEIPCKNNFPLNS
jgi:hypothetical protein